MRLWRLDTGHVNIGSDEVASRGGGEWSGEERGRCKLGNDTIDGFERMEFAVEGRVSVKREIYLLEKHRRGIGLAK